MENRIIYRLVLIGAISILFITACRKTTNYAYQVEPLNAEKTIKYTHLIDTLPSSFIDTVNWIPLENSDFNVFKEISKLSVINDKVIIGDKQHGRIHVYEYPSGKYLYTIDRKGNGPEEYLETASFTVTPTSIYTLDNYSHKISRYSVKDGSFLEKKTISFVAWDMEAYDDDAFLFTWLSNNPEAPKPSSAIDNAVWLTDGDFNITETYLPVEDNYTEIYGKARYFTKHGNDIIFHALKYNGYFNFVRNKQPVFFPIEFPNPLPEDHTLRLSDLKNISSQYLGETPFVSDNCTVFEITEGTDAQQMFASEEKIFGNSHNWARNLPINIIGVTDNNKFIGYINDNYEQYCQLIKYGFQKGTDEVENLLHKNGCCLIVYEIKTE
ncbi:MAG: 6-bladed beta-propeller [Muribaculaceae bacterium]|nr:6-bladed beta-propeller [Muribaculaceae bacterium]